MEAESDNDSYEFGLYKYEGSYVNGKYEEKPIIMMMVNYYMKEHLKMVCFMVMVNHIIKTER